MIGTRWRPGVSRSSGTLRGVGQREGKRRAALDGAFCPDASAVTPDDPRHRGKADSRAFESTPVQPPEGVEELARVPHVEARAVIADEVHQATVLSPHTEFDARC